MNAFERALFVAAPSWAARRAQARERVLRANAFSSAYEAAEPGRLRKRTRDFGSGNNAVATSARTLRDYARHLDRNHDLARGVLNVLVRNVVGPTGISVEPAPRLPGSFDVDPEMRTQLVDLYSKFCKRPEVTRQFDAARTQQLLARSWFRDGEALFQNVLGYVPFLTHGSEVPYSIEMIECDLLPADFNDPAKGILQGVERDAWGQPRAFHLYKQHPGDPGAGWNPEIKRVSADVIRHIRSIDRIGQVRGVSIFASVLTRLDDLKDYEESERIAAKIAASLAAVIKKGDPQSYMPEEGEPGPLRKMRMQPGMIFDDLRPGESVETIDSKRPNAGLEPYRNGQLRAVAAGADVSYSSSSRNYNGTYSAQRQELVEQWSAYALLSNAFIDMAVRPMWEAFVSAALLGNQIQMARAATFAEISAARFIAPQMPWIDPLKEAEANEILEDRAWRPGPEIIRRMGGGDPNEVIRSQELWLKLKKEAGIPDASSKPPTLPPADSAPTQENT